MILHLEMARLSSHGSKRTYLNGESSTEEASAFYVSILDGNWRSWGMVSSSIVNHTDARVGHLDFVH